MKTNRRDFLKSATLLGLGSSVFTVSLPHTGWGARAERSAFRRSMASMGTLVNISVFDVPEKVAQEAVRRAFAEIRDVDRLMTTFDPGSQLSAVNRVAGNELLPVDPRLSEVLAASLDFSRHSNGLFDVTTLPLLEAWGFREDPDSAHRPDDKKLAFALEKVGYRHVELQKGQVGLARRGAEIDLGGIAKGYAVDRAIAALVRFGVQRAIVEAGGDLFALGSPEDSDGWNIGLKHPLEPHTLCATITVKNQAVTTSGNYENFVVYDGHRYGHLLDPFTGEPVETYLSTTAVAATTLAADAASTTLYVAGRNQNAPVPAGIEWLHIFSENGRSLEFLASANFPSWSVIE